MTRRDIEENQDKFQVVTTMISPTNVKEVQELTTFLTALFRFLSCAAYMAFHFFIVMKKKERFEWTSECEEVFS